MATILLTQTTMMRILGNVIHFKFHLVKKLESFFVHEIDCCMHILQEF